MLNVSKRSVKGRFAGEPGGDFRSRLNAGGRLRRGQRRAKSRLKRADRSRASECPQFGTSGFNAQATFHELQTLAFLMPMVNKRVFRVSWQVNVLQLQIRISIFCFDRL